MVVIQIIVDIDVGIAFDINIDVGVDVDVAGLGSRVADVRRLHIAGHSHGSQSWVAVTGRGSQGLHRQRQQPPGRRQGQQKH